MSPKPFVFFAAISFPLRVTLALLVAVATCVVAVGIAWALELNEDAKLTASDAASGDFFGGFSVSVHGDTALIGSAFDDDAGDSSGSAYVFVRDMSGAWSQQAKLTASDAAAEDSFGVAVSVDGDTVLIGAHRDDDAGEFSGSAYVFVRDMAGGWRQQAKLTASDGTLFDLFGFSVSVQGDTALVGALNHDESGAAYVFVRDTSGAWSQQAKLTASDAAPEDSFGRAVSLHDDTALIGAAADDEAGFDNTGAAYVFVRDMSGEWSQQAKLTASDAAPEDSLGSSVSVNSDTALVGAGGDDDAGESSGSAYVFVRDMVGEWSQQAKLTASDAAIEEFFGDGSVAVDGDTALVGAGGDDDAGVANGGAAYVFVRDMSGVWSQQVKLTASDAAPGDVFGSSVSFNGDTALIGAVGDDDAGFVDSGAVYVFTPIPPTPEKLVEVLTGKVNDLGLQKGIETSLDAKLNAAQQILEDLNPSNDLASVGPLRAFIKAVETKRGNQILDPDANELITEAQAIIDLLLGQ